MNLAEFVANLKADGGLLPWSLRTEFAPKSRLGPSLGVNGRCVDWTRRDCLASLIMSAHDFLKLLRRGVKVLQTSCLVSIELSQFAHSGLCDYHNIPFLKIILCTYAYLTSLYILLHQTFVHLCMWKQSNSLWSANKADSVLLSWPFLCFMSVLPPPLVLWSHIHCASSWLLPQHTLSLVYCILFQILITTSLAIPWQQFYAISCVIEFLS